MRTKIIVLKRAEGFCVATATGPEPQQGYLSTVPGLVITEQPQSEGPPVYTLSHHSGYRVSAAPFASAFHADAACVDHLAKYDWTGPGKPEGLDGIREALFWVTAAADDSWPDEEGEDEVAPAEPTTGGGR